MSASRVLQVRGWSCWPRVVALARLCVVCWDHCNCNFWGGQVEADPDMQASSPKENAAVDGGSDRQHEAYAACRDAQRLGG